MELGHFMQSPEWERYEQAEGHATLRIAGKGFEAMAVVAETPVGRYFYVPYGPTVVDREGLLAAAEALKALAKEKKAIFVRVEPTLALVDGDSEDKNVLTVDFMKKHGFVKSHDIDPAHTWVVDLTRPKEDILAEIEKNRVRLWRNLAKKGVTLRKTKNPEEIGILVGLLKKLGEIRKFSPQDEAHLRRQLEAGFATLYIAEYEGKAIAATLMDDYEGVRFVMHAAADEDYRKLRAGPCLAVEAMMDAKEAGMREFDFWGMTTSEDPKHPWYGFTQYKKSFGGRQVDYAGTWDLPVEKLKYQVYKAMRGANRLKRKILK